MRKLIAGLVVVLAVVLFVARRTDHREMPAVSDAEVQDALDEIKRQNHLDDAGLERELAAQGYTVERYKAELRDQLRALRARTPVAR